MGISTPQIFILILILFVVMPIWVHIIARMIASGWVRGQFDAMKTITIEEELNNGEKVKTQVDEE